MEKTKTDNIRYYGFYYDGFEWILESVDISGKTTKIDISSSKKHIVDKCKELNAELAAQHEKLSKKKNKPGDFCIEVPELKEVMEHVTEKLGAELKEKQQAVLDETYHFVRKNIHLLV